MADTLDRFTRRARQALTLAQEEAQRLRQNYIGTEHLLVGLIRVENSQSSRVLRKLGVSVRKAQELVERTVGYGQKREVSGEQIRLTQRTKRVLELAVNEARALGHHYIDTGHLLLGLVQQEDGVAVDILRRLGVSPEIIRRETTKTMHQVPAREPGKRSKQSSKGSALERVATDLTAWAREGKLDPVIGRQTEIERVIQILSRRTKSNPALIGEPGVGKTAIVEGIAQKIVAQNIQFLSGGKADTGEEGADDSVPF